MSDEDAPTFIPPHPAIPSRAHPSIAQDEGPTFSDPIVPSPSKRSRKGTRKAYKAPSQLPPAEIKRINRNRKKNMRKATATPRSAKAKRGRPAGSVNKPKSVNPFEDIARGRDPLNPLLKLIEMFREIPIEKRASALAILRGLIS